MTANRPGVQGQPHPDLSVAMNIRTFVMTLPPLLLAPISHGAASTGTPFYGDPPDEHHPWAIHDRNRPQPKRVEPGTFSSAAQPGKPPSDATVLFDGSPESLAKWESDTKPDEPNAPTKWIVTDGAMECVPKSGYIRTKEQFGDCQLHVEWAAPKEIQGHSQGRGNSGNDSGKKQNTSGRGSSSQDMESGKERRSSGGNNGNSGRSNNR